MDKETVINLLLSPSPRCEAILLILEEFGSMRTGEVAAALGLDRSNTGRRLERLAEEGRVILVDDCDYVEGRPGRPSRLWELAESNPKKV